MIYILPGRIKMSAIFLEKKKKRFTLFIQNTTSRNHSKNKNKKQKYTDKGYQKWGHTKKLSQCTNRNKCQE